jgi:hypothetical protein
MRSSPLLLALLLLVAAGLVAVVFLAGTAPASCKQANESMDSKLVAQANTAYGTILKDEPDSRCARAGMHRVVIELCARGDRLRLNNQWDQARKVYTSVLTADLPDWDPAERPDWNVECALEGLKLIPTATLAPTSTPSTCGCQGLPAPKGDPGPKGQHGHGPRGKRGKRGKRAHTGGRGRRGPRGPQGAQGPPGPQGPPGAPGGSGTSGSCSSRACRGGS